MRAQGEQNHTYITQETRLAGAPKAGQAMKFVDLFASSGAVAHHVPEGTKR